MTKNLLKIGNLEPYQEYEETDIDSLFTNVNVVKLLIPIAGRNYVISVEELLSIEKKLPEMSDNDLDIILEKSSSWLYTLISAKSDVKVIFKKQKRENERWVARLIRDYRDRIPERNPNDTRILREALLKDENNIKYESQMLELDKLENMIDKMEGLYDTLSKRVETLRTIIRNRRELKGGKGGDSAI